MNSKLAVLLLTAFLIMGSGGLNSADATLIQTPTQTAYSESGTFGSNYYWQFDDASPKNSWSLFTDLFYNPEAGFNSINQIGTETGVDNSSGNFYDVNCELAWDPITSSTCSTGNISAGVYPGSSPDFTYFGTGTFTSDTLDTWMSSIATGQDSLTYNVASELQTTVVPEPISSILFLTGSGLLAGRRFFRRNN